LLQSWAGKGTEKEKEEEIGSLTTYRERKTSLFYMEGTREKLSSSTT